jgi:hypothetical protein
MAVSLSETKQTPQNPNGILGKLTNVVVFLFPVAMHLSLVFKFFSALPIAYIFTKYGRFWGAFASILNLIIVWATVGRLDAAWFFVVAIVLGVTLSETVKLKLRIEWIIVLCVTAILVSSIFIFTYYSVKKKSNPIAMVQSFVSEQVDEFIVNVKKYKDSSSTNSQDFEKIIADPEATKKNILETAPSVLLIAILILVVSNLILFLKLKFNRLRRGVGFDTRFFMFWKTPDHLVWPTLISAFLLVLEVPGTYVISLNVFRVLMALYAIHGLAIISAFLYFWRIKPIYRPIIYVLSVSLILPLVIGLGFFDLWLNFRQRFFMKMNQNKS